MKFLALLILLSAGCYYEEENDFVVNLQGKKENGEEYNGHLDKYIYKITFKSGKKIDLVLGEGIQFSQGETQLNFSHSTFRVSEKPLCYTTCINSSYWGCNQYGETCEGGSAKLNLDDVQSIVPVGQLKLGSKTVEVKGYNLSSELTTGKSLADERNGNSYTLYTLTRTDVLTFPEVLANNSAELDVECTLDDCDYQIVEEKKIVAEADMTPAEKEEAKLVHEDFLSMVTPVE